MKFVGSTGIAGLFLLCGTIAPAYAQQDQQNEKTSKPDKQQDSQKQQGQPRARGRQQRGPSQERRGEPAQPAKEQRPEQQQRQSAQQPGQQQRQEPDLQRQPQQRQQAQQERPQQSESPQQVRQQPQRTHQQAAAWQQQRGWLRQGGWQEHSTFQQNRAQRWETDHRTWAQRGGYGGYYIPQATFNITFGSQHWFRMRSQPTMYMGYPRFYYGGFSFLLLDPWPEYWVDNWYSTDDIYIDYDDGYYLYNRTSPGIRLAITVVM